MDSSNTGLEDKSLAKLINILNEYDNFKYPSDPKFLIPFLRVRKYDVNAAAETILNFFECRESMFCTISLLPKDHKDLMRYNYGGLLKNRDPLGRPVYVHKCVWNIDEGHGYDDLQLYLYFVMQELFKRMDVQNEGLIVIMDYSQLSWAHVKETGLTRCRSFVNLQYSLPVSLKQVHIVFNPFIFNIIYGFAKPFLKEKLKKRINLYGKDLNSFHKALPKAILPMSLGGDLTDEDAYNTDLIENLLQKNDEYKEFQKYGFK